MPVLTVRTTPMQGYVRIFRVTGRYGILNEGLAPVDAWREYPFDVVVEMEPVVDRAGTLWMPETYQDRFVVPNDMFKMYRYVKLGPARDWMG